MKSELPKVLNPIKGEPMINYLIKTVKWSGVPERPIIVVSPANKNLIKRALKNFNCCYAVQKEQLGTAHALQKAEPYLRDFTGTVMVLCGDTPLISPATMRDMAIYHQPKRYL